MIKHIQSHENNISPQELSVIKAQEAILENCKTSDIVSCKSRMLDPKIRPFLEDWKAQNNHRKNTPLPASFLASCRSPDIIKDNENVSKEVPCFYLDEEYVERCKKYNIPYKEVYHSYRELDAAEELVADYVDLLKSVKDLCIYWDESNYDPEGLQELIDEHHSEEVDHGYFADLRSDRWVYYASTGV